MSQLCATTTSSQADKDATQPGGVLVEAAAEALVSDVDQRDQPALGHDPRHLGPLLGIEVRAGRVVAAAVEQNDIAGSRAAKRVSHRIEADDGLAALVIRVFDDFEANLSNDRRVVRPRRRSYEHPRVGIGHRDQLEPQPQRAAAPGRLDAGNPLVRSMLAEQDRTKQLGEALVARASEIGFALLRLEQDALGLLHHLEDRRAALTVAKHADPDIDLVGPRIGIGHGDQGEQRVTLDGREIGKPSCLSVGFAEHGHAISEVRRRNPPPRRRRPEPTGRSAHNQPPLLHR